MSSNTVNETSRQSRLIIFCFILEEHLKEEACFVYSLSLWPWYRNRRGLLRWDGKYFMGVVFIYGERRATFRLM